MLKEEITELIVLDKYHRQKWFQTTGLLSGLNSEEEKQTLDLFNTLVDNWNIYGDFEEIYEYMLPMIRRAINYLYSDESMIWSIKKDSKRLLVYRHKFNLLDYMEHFNEIFLKSRRNFTKTFKNIDAEAELCHLCIRDYFYKLADDSKSEDYESIIRDLKINTIIE